MSEDHSSSRGTEPASGGVREPHTPGPWVKDRYGSLRGSNGHEVTVTGLGIGLVTGYSTSEEFIANACLIVQAPDMLAFIKKVARMSSQSDLRGEAVEIIAKALSPSTASPAT